MDSGIVLYLMYCLKLFTPSFYFFLRELQGPYCLQFSQIILQKEVKKSRLPRHFLELFVIEKKSWHISTVGYIFENVSSYIHVFPLIWWNIFLGLIKFKTFLSQPTKNSNFQQIIDIVTSTPLMLPLNLLASEKMPPPSSLN